MLDADALDTDLVVGEDLGLEVSMELTAEEGQDIFGAEAAGGMLQQLFVQWGQAGPISKQDIQGQFTLVADPVVTIA